MTDIKIFQTYYLESQKVNLDKGFTPLDVSNNPNSDFREIPILTQLFDQKKHLKSDYVGLFSHKFSKKSKLDSTKIYEFIHNNPGYDLYIINPFPQNSYHAYNVWEQGEEYHEGIKELADLLFKKANLPYRTESTGRNMQNTLSYSNFWIGSKNFWNFYIPIIKKLMKTIQSLPKTERNKYHKRTFHSEPCVMAPFIFERLLSTVLKHKNNIKYISYKHSTSEIHNACINEIEKIIVDKFSGLIDSWDTENGIHANQRNIFDGLTKIAAAHTKLIHKYGKHPF